MATHEYAAAVTWKGGREGQGSIEADRLQTPVSVPPEFQGPGNGTNPEELLTSSIAACYTMTFAIIAQNRKIPVAGLRTEATGEVEQAGAQFTYKKVTLRPRIELEGGASSELRKLAEDMAHKADAYCIITNAVRGKVEILVEPTIV